jgi:hypothetical protein
VGRAVFAMTLLRAVFDRVRGCPVDFSDMSKVLGFCLSLALLACLPTLANAEGASPATVNVKVAALAADVQSVVFVDDRGQLQRYAVGDMVAGSDWRVVQVGTTRVTLESSQRLNGRPLSMCLTSDQSVDLGATEAALLALHRPLAVPGAVSVRASKRTPVPRH